MSIGLFDGDIAHYGDIPFNLDLMKLFSYYNKKREIVSLMSKFQPFKFSKVIYFMDYPFSVAKYENLEYRGLYFTNDNYMTLPPQVELCNPSTLIYQHLKYKFSEEEFRLLTNAQHIRLSLDNKTVWSDYLKPNIVQTPPRIVFLHDKNITKIENHYEAIQDAISYFKLGTRQRSYISTKFPIKLKNVKDLLKWYNLPLAREFRFQMNKTFDAKELAIIQRLKDCQTYKIELILTSESATEEEFFGEQLNNVLKEIIFFRDNNIEFSLKYEKNFFSDFRSELFIKLLNYYCKEERDRKVNRILDKRRYVLPLNAPFMTLEEYYEIENYILNIAPKSKYLLQKPIVTFEQGGEIQYEEWGTN